MVYITIHYLCYKLSKKIMVNAVGAKTGSREEVRFKFRLLRSVDTILAEIQLTTYDFINFPLS